MFKHSVKVPRLYKVAAKIAKEVTEGIGSVKYLVYEHRKKHPNIKAIYALVTTLFQRNDELECLLKRSQFFAKEPRADPWLSKILIVELLWGTKRLSGGSTPETTVKGYEQIFKAHLSDVSLKSKLIDDVKAKIKPRYVRVNTLSTSINEAVERFRNEGWNLCTLPDKADYQGFLHKITHLAEDEFLIDIHIPDLLIFPPKTTFYNHVAYKNGSIVLQDKASCLPVHILNPPPGSTVLDMCAAPGMKTTQLAAALNNQGTVYAVERDPKRFEILNKIVENLGATCVKTENKDVLTCNSGHFPGVEYIIVDPSCSGSGITDRLEFEQEKILQRMEKLAGFQIKILRSALTRYPQVKRVVYSTCSINPEENEDVLRQVLETNMQFKLVPAKQFVNDTWENFGSSDYGDIGKYCLYAKPNEDFTNGFFVAVLERLGEGEENQFFNTKIYNYKKHIHSQERRKGRKQQERDENEQINDNEMNEVTIDPNLKKKRIIREHCAVENSDNKLLQNDEIDKGPNKDAYINKEEEKILFNGNDEPGVFKIANKKKNKSKYVVENADIFNETEKIIIKKKHNQSRNDFEQSSEYCFGSVKQNKNKKKKGKSKEVTETVVENKDVDENDEINKIKSNHINEETEKFKTADKKKTKRKQFTVDHDVVGDDGISKKKKRKPSENDVDKSDEYQVETFKEKKKKKKKELAQESIGSIVEKKGLVTEEALNQQLSNHKKRVNKELHDDCIETVKEKDLEISAKRKKRKSQKPKEYNHNEEILNNNETEIINFVDKKKRNSKYLTIETDAFDDEEISKKKKRKQLENDVEKFDEYHTETLKDKKEKKKKELAKECIGNTEKKDLVAEETYSQEFCTNTKSITNCKKKKKDKESEDECVVTVNESSAEITTKRKKSKSQKSAEPNRNDETGNNGDTETIKTSNKKKKKPVDKGISNEIEEKSRKHIQEENTEISDEYQFEEVKDKVKKKKKKLPLDNTGIISERKDGVAEETYAQGLSTKIERHTDRKKKSEEMLDEYSETVNDNSLKISVKTKNSKSQKSKEPNHDEESFNNDETETMKTADSKKNSKHLILDKQISSEIEETGENEKCKLENDFEKYNEYQVKETKDKTNKKMKKISLEYVDIIVEKKDSFAEVSYGQELSANAEYINCEKKESEHLETVDENTVETTAKRKKNKFHKSEEHNQNEEIFSNELHIKDNEDIIKKKKNGKKCWLF